MADLLGNLLACFVLLLLLSLIPISIYVGVAYIIEEEKLKRANERLDRWNRIINSIAGIEEDEE